MRKTRSAEFHVTKNMDSWGDINIDLNQTCIRDRILFCI